MNYEALDKDIICGEDGYFIYWPMNNNGAYSSWHLRLIAQILDEINDKWDKEINEYFDRFKDEIRGPRRT